MKLDKIKDSVMYDVRITAVVRRGERKYLPRFAHQMTGAVIKEIAAQYGSDVFETATQVKKLKLPAKRGAV